MPPQMGWCVEICCDFEIQSIWLGSPGKVVTCRTGLRATSLKKMTLHTITTVARIQQGRALVRSEGFAVSREEYRPGIVGVGTAAALSGVPFGSASVLIATARIGF